MGRPRLVTITCVLRDRFALPYASEGQGYALAFVTGTGNRRRVAHVLHLADTHAVARLWTDALRFAEFTDAWGNLEALARDLKDDVDVYVIPEDASFAQVRFGLGCVHALRAEYRAPKRQRRAA